MTERMKEVATAYLQVHLDEALNLAQEMNSYDGCYDWTDAWDWDELCALAAAGGAEAVDELCRAAVYGETYGCKCAYDAYGNLKPAEYEDLLRDADSYLTDIMSGLENYIDDDGYSKLNISNELQELLNTCIEYDEEEEE